VDAFHHCENLNDFLHERQAEMAVLQQREASLPTTAAALLQLPAAATTARSRL